MKGIVHPTREIILNELPEYLKRERWTRIQKFH